ncbi:MAG: ATP-dependent zinc metalloprotease FtsH [Planctomycetia bacterium]|nr:ATP-dependent zinc metalloprotease FtsH [Planctomycetia bacterium]
MILINLFFLTNIIMFDSNIIFTQKDDASFDLPNKPDNSSQDMKTSSNKNGKSRKKEENWNSILIILVVVFGAIFLWNSYYQPSRFEIPLMQLVKLIEQGNPENRTIQLPENSDTDQKSTEAPFVVVTEGKGRNEKKVKYSHLKDICIGSYEVTGKITREVLEPKENKPKQQKDVSFFSGRQGLNFDNNELFNRLEENGFNDVRAKGNPGFMEQYGFTLLLTGLFVFFLFYIFRKGAGAMAFGRNPGILIAPEDIDISFEDVAGVDEAVDELKEIVEFLKTPMKFQVLGGRIPKGVLLVGPPGTGKTLLAKAVAGEAGVPFFSLSGSDFVELYAGVGAARVRDLFEQAQRTAPCIIFIDELDALGKSRTGNSFGAHDEREQTLNALLVEMDGFGTNSGTIVMAATNRPETLDSALLRSGRFDRQVLVDRPDISGREDILKIHSKNVKLDSEINLRHIASITSGFVGADLAALVNEAALLAARAGKKFVTMDEFTEGVERVTAGLQKKKRIMTEAEKNRVSFHECGHALMAYSLPNADPVHKVSIIPRGLAALGYTLQRPDDERFLMTKSELETRIQILLAGTIAEDIAFQDVSTGAQNDLERATEIARNMVMNFGMSRLGRINYRESPSSYLNDNNFISTRQHSERTAWEIDREVKSIIDSLYEKTYEFLSNQFELLKKLAQRLLEKEIIDAEELRNVIEENN